MLPLASAIAGASDRTFPTSLLTSLVGYYSFNEASGTTVTDRSSSGINGTLTNASIRSAGIVEGGLLFDGTNYCNFATTLNLFGLGNSYTLSAWMYIANASDIVRALNCNNRSSPSNASVNCGFYIGIIAGQFSTRFVYTQINVPGADGRGYYISSIPAVVGWNLMVVTRTSTAGIFTIFNNNGKFLDPYSYSSNSVDFSNGNALNEIGQAGANVSTSGSRLDEVGIWNRVLTDAEIQELWNAGNGRTKL